MCRYGITYKPRFACFRCRKAWRRRLLVDMRPGIEEQPPRCPDCQGPAAEMGLDFQPPRRDRVRAWKLVEDLHVAGITFHSCGCSGPGYRPRERSQWQAFLRSVLDEYRKHLQAWEQSPREPRSADERARVIRLWRARIERVRAALEAA